MNINLDRVGRTATGRYTRQPLVQMTADDYHPDSNYWKGRFATARVEFEQRYGRVEYCAWAEETWPGDLIDGKTWRDLCEDVERYIQERAEAGAAERAMLERREQGDRAAEALAETVLELSDRMAYLAKDECVPFGDLQEVELSQLGIGY